MGVLLAPKLFGLVAALLERRTRVACGGAIRLIARKWHLDGANARHAYLDIGNH